MRQKFSWATSSPQARIDAITRKNELAYNTTRAVFTDTDGEGDRLLTTFLAGLRCSERDRLWTFLAGLRFHSDRAVLQWLPSGGRRWRSGATR